MPRCMFLSTRSFSVLFTVNWFGSVRTCADCVGRAENSFTILRLCFCEYFGLMPSLDKPEKLKTQHLVPVIFSLIFAFTRNMENMLHDSATDDVTKRRGFRNLEDCPLCPPEDFLTPGLDLILAQDYCFRLNYRYLPRNSKKKNQPKSFDSGKFWIKQINTEINTWFP